MSREEFDKEPKLRGIPNDTPEEKAMVEEAQKTVEAIPVITKEIRDSFFNSRNNFKDSIPKPKPGDNPEESVPETSQDFGGDESLEEFRRKSRDKREKGKHTLSKEEKEIAATKKKSINRKSIKESDIKEDSEIPVFAEAETKGPIKEKSPDEIAEEVLGKINKRWKEELDQKAEEVLGKINKTKDEELPNQEQEKKETKQQEETKTEQKEKPKFIIGDWVTYTISGEDWWKEPKQITEILEVNGKLCAKFEDGDMVPFDNLRLAETKELPGAEVYLDKKIKQLRVTVKDLNEKYKLEIEKTNKALLYSKLEDAKRLLDHCQEEREKIANKEKHIAKEKKTKDFLDSLPEIMAEEPTKDAGFPEEIDFSENIEEKKPEKVEEKNPKIEKLKNKILGIDKELELWSKDIKTYTALRPVYERKIRRAEKKKLKLEKKISKILNKRKK